MSGDHHEDRPASGGTTTSPRDFTIVTPAGWHRLPLVPEQRRNRAVDELLAQQFRGVDDQPRLRRELREMLVNATDDGIRRGGIEMYMSMETILDVPMPASLLVCFVPPDGLEGREAGADRLATLLQDGDGHVSFAELPAGRAVRRHRKSLPREVKELGAEMPVTVLDFFLPIPGDGAVLLLTFSTPLEPVAEAMVEMFDAVAASLTWVH